MSWPEASCFLYWWRSLVKSTQNKLSSGKRKKSMLFFTQDHPSCPVKLQINKCMILTNHACIHPVSLPYSNIICYLFYDILFLDTVWFQRMEWWSQWKSDAELAPIMSSKTMVFWYSLAAYNFLTLFISLSESITKTFHVRRKIFIND